MNGQSLTSLFNSLSPTVLIMISVGALIALSALHQRFGFYLWYFLVLLAGFGAAAVTQNQLYFYAFSLGVVTAFAEIIGKFSDEPIKTLRTPHALVYHLLNGFIAAFALKVLIIFGAAHEAPLDRLKIVLAAGLGSMMVMRSKLFNIKVGGEDVAFGPEQIIKVFFRFMEAAIDRVRAQSRVDFVKTRLCDIDFDKVVDYSITMLQAAQAIDPKDLDDCKKSINDLRNTGPADPRLKSYQLGFLLLNKMGEDFVAKLFDNAPPEWKFRAPVSEPRESTLLNRIFAGGDGYVWHMAYGSSMSGKRFRERMGWGDMEETKFSESVLPQRCELHGYRLAFNKPEIINGVTVGLANIVEDPNGVVEGVIYQLSKEQMEFLDRSENGYRRQPVTVKAGDKDIAAHVYTAESIKEGLAPAKEYLEILIDGAREQRLSGEYIQQLESFRESVLPEVARGVATGN
jgi:hypothetical protein